MAECGVTYRLSFDRDPGWAVGSTVRSLQERKDLYWQCAVEGSPRTRLYELIRTHGHHGFTLTEIDMHYCEDIQQLRKAEQELLEDHFDKDCLNVKPAYYHKHLQYKKGSPVAVGSKTHQPPGRPQPKATLSKGTTHEKVMQRLSAVGLF